MLDLDLSEFHQLCGISVIIDENGRNPVLCASCNVRDSDGEYHELKRSIALQPIMEMIADRIRAIHDKLHLDMQVSGIFGSSFDMAMARKRGLVSPAKSKRGGISDHRTNAGGPYQSRRAPPENRKMEGKKWAGLEDQGEDESRGRSFLDGPENMDLLPPGQDPLEIQGWFDSIKNIARRVGEIKIVKSLYSDIKKAGDYARQGMDWAKAHQDYLKKIAANSGIPGAESAVEYGFKAYDMVKGAKAGHPEAVEALQKIKALADGGDAKAQLVINQAKAMNYALNAKASGMHVSGWLYNKPYRTNAQTLLDAASGKFPTMSLALREGWHDGLAFAGTMHRKNWSPFA